MGHTPGPWMLNGWDVVQRDCTDKFPALAAILIGDGNLCMEEINANASLIAAAPELLAALKEARDYLAEFFEEGREHRVVVAADAAIAKAEGRGE